MGRFRKLSREQDSSCCPDAAAPPPARAFSAAVAVLLVAGFAFAATVPEQPIAFNHKLHVDMKMECTDCHQLALSSRHAGLPTANLCMACHRSIKASSPEVKKIAQYKTAHQSIPWVRLYQLPPFVYYNHERHVRAAGLPCKTCHMATGTEAVTVAYRTFTMGFCMDCHKERKVSNDCSICHR